MSNITVTGLESILGFARGSLSKIDNHKPSADKLQKIADYFHVRVEWLQGISEYKTDDEMFQNFSNNSVLSFDQAKIKKGSLLPIIGFSRAGIPNLAIEQINWDDITEWEEISPRLAKTGKFFALYIKGDSMEPELTEKDVVIVKQQNDAETGDIVIAKVNGDEACCKKLIKHDDGITLQSLNTNYFPMFFSNKEIAEKPVTIIGKVIESRRKY
jgi:repressor LexA